MTEFGRTPETDRTEKAVQWLNDVRLTLDRQDEAAVDPTDERFALRLERGMDISAARVEVLATLQDRREAFFAASGADPILEQFCTFKLALEPKK